MAKGLKLWLGIPAMLLGIPATIAGLVLLAVVGTDGRFTTPTTSVRTDATAIVFRASIVDEDLRSGPASGSLATTVGVDVRSDDGPVFVGVGDADRVARYLEGAAVAEAVEVDYPWGTLSIDERPGSARPEPPGEQGFWLASSDRGRLSWTVDTGDWVVVVMRPDAAPGLDVEGTATVELPVLGTVTVAALAVGVPLLVVGFLLVVSAIRQRPGPAPEIPASVPPRRPDL
ncbi:MAG TPA: hypothetical protein VF044_07770 [Actinomycetota bacterium]